jgi:hypothetical protein
LDNSQYNFNGRKLLYLNDLATERLAGPPFWGVYAIIANAVPKIIFIFSKVLG